MAGIYRFAEVISCHSWRKDGKQVAICPNNNEIHIYEKQGNGWKVVHKLTEHTQIVTGLDWGSKGRLLSCSQDRNAYVWNFDAGSKKWKPTLVILRLNRCATNVSWSPDEKKFAVSTGAKVASICYFEKDNDWWVSKHIKKHKSTVLSVKWHPNNTIVATTSSDFRCRVFSAWTKGVDKRGVTAPAGLPQDKSLEKFGSLLAEFQCNGWVKDCAFSPSGNLLAFVGQDSSLTVADLTQKDSSVTLKLGTLPLARIIFPSEDTVIGVGYNCEPFVFKNSGGWKKVKSLDPKKPVTSKKSNVASMWRNMDKKGTKKSADKLLTKHQNAITWIEQTQQGKATTSGLDGNIVWWNL